MKLSHIAQRVIAITRIVRAEDAAIRAEKSKDPAYKPMLDNSPPTVAKTEFKAYLRNQPAAVLYALITVMYAGRGDWDISDFVVQYEKVRGSFNKPIHAADQMIGKIPLADYLERGLQQLDEAGIDIDTVLEL